MEEFGEIHSKALKSLNYMIDGLKYQRWFYEGDIEYEYTPFEESIKEYCDSYADEYIAHNKGEKFFNSLKMVIEAILNSNADVYDDDFFRPVELIVYYLGKLSSSDTTLKDKVRGWLSDFCDEYDDDYFVEQYYKKFLNGEKIYHADNYYTGYKDFNKMIRVFK